MKDWTKWNRKMGGRSFSITSGAFKDTLVHMLATTDIWSDVHGNMVASRQVKVIAYVTMQGK